MKSKRAVVKIYEGQILLNDEPVLEIEELLKLTNDFDELSVEAHEGVNPAKVITVMDTIRVTWRRAIRFKDFAAPK